MSQYETRRFRSRGTLLVSYFALLITQISVGKNFVHIIQNGANAQQVKVRKRGKSPSERVSFHSLCINENEMDSDWTDWWGLV